MRANAEGPIRIGRPSVTRREDRALVEARIEGTERTDRLWFSVPAEFGTAFADDTAVDAFVLALIPIAMRSGQPIVASGRLSDRLAYHLPRHYMPMLASFMPRLRPVEIEAEDVGAGHPQGSGVGTGVSGGIDSFSVIADHHFGSVPGLFRISHLVYHNVGSHGRSSEGDRVFAERLARIRRLARELELPLLEVDSNLHHALPFPYSRTHTLRGSSVAHTLTGVLSRYLVASSITYSHTRFGPGRDVSNIDAAAVPLLATSTMDIVLAGTQYSRVDKTRQISDLDLTYRYLDICVEAEKAARAGRVNCSRCWKCTRTMLTLELLGRLDRYGAVFDLEDWRRHRGRRIQSVIGHGGPLVPEVVELAKREGVRLPLPSVASGSVVRAGRHIKDTLKRVRHRHADRGRGEAAAQD